MNVQTDEWSQRIFMQRAKNPVASQRTKCRCGNEREKSRFAGASEDIMKILAATTLCILLAVPASAETLAEKTGINSTLGVAPKTGDFVTEAANSDMFEIASSKLAAERADAATKSFAEQMITDHRKTSEELKPLAASAKVEVPASMDASHKDMLAKLSGLKGDDFSKQYKSDQVTAHKDAVSLFERYAKDGSESALKAFAGKTLPTLQGHLKMAQDLYKNS